jgi:hypothetical protein
MNPGERRAATAWLGLAAATGIVLILLHPKSAEPDSGFHFLKARWAFDDPVMFVDVWARPLFQVAYAIPAQAGLLAARLFALALSLATAWVTFRIADRLGMARPGLAILFLFVQPVWLIYCHDTMTEPLFALGFAVALLLHHSDRRLMSMLVASLLPLARPEGFAIAVLWGVWTLAESSLAPAKRLARIPALAAGTLAWWLAALILHNWPAIWDPGSVVYGRGHPLWFVMCLPVIVGPIMIVPLIAGLVSRRPPFTIVSSFLSILVLHSALWYLGRFGSVGFPRYLICVAPATALLALAGWNRIADAISRRDARVASWIGAAGAAASLLLAFWYADAQPQTRDGRPMAEMARRFHADPVSFDRFAWSHPHACIVFDRNPGENPNWTAHRDRNLELVRALPGGTLVLWDRHIGSAWYHLEARDFAEAGFVRRQAVDLYLPGRLPPLFGMGAYVQDLQLLYKPK